MPTDSAPRSVATAQTPVFSFYGPLRLGRYRKVSKFFTKPLSLSLEHLPLVFLYDYGDLTGFGLPSYVGDYRRRRTGTRYNEAVATLGAVLGGTFAGIDKSAGPHNWVKMCRQHYVEAHGEGVVLNDPTDRSGGARSFPRGNYARQLPQLRSAEKLGSFLCQLLMRIG